MIDFSRLCERIELVPRLDIADVERVVSLFWRHCLEYGADQGDLRIARVRMRKRSALGRALLRELGRINHPFDALRELLLTPRAIKHVLRQVWDAWQDLHGEVNFEDLLLAAVIRVCAPRAFDFIIDNYSSLVSLGQPSRGSRTDSVALSKQLQEDFRNRSRDSDRRVADAVWYLIAFLFPKADASVVAMDAKAAQSITEECYWRRIVSGAIEKGPRDQRVVRATLRWKKSRNASLVRALATSRKYAAVFERIHSADHVLPSALRLDARMVTELAGKVMHCAVGTQYQEASAETIAGFLPLWRLALHRERDNGYSEWVVVQALNHMRDNLQLSNDIAYYWGSTKQMLLTGEEGHALRSEMVQRARIDFTPALLCSILSRRHLWTLQHFVVHRYGGEAYDKHDWQWLGERLIAAMSLGPKVVPLQVCVLLAERTDRLDTTGRLGSPIVSEYQLDRAVARAIVPGDAVLIALLTELWKWDEETVELAEPDKAIVESVRRDATEWLDELSKERT